MKAPIWEGLYFWPLASTQASPLLWGTILNGTASMSFLTSGSLNLRPINLLVANSVFSGFTTAWRNGSVKDQLLIRITLFCWAYLTLCRKSNQAFTVFCKRHHRGSRSSAFRIFNHLGRFSFHDCDTTIGCTQVNTNDLTLDLLAVKRIYWMRLWNCMLGAMVVLEQVTLQPAQTCWWDAPSGQGKIHVSGR